MAWIGGIKPMQLECAGTVVARPGRSSRQYSTPEFIERKQG